MVTAVIFDMDGLMFDSEAVWADCWKQLLPQYGYACPQSFIEESLGVNLERQEEIIRAYCAQDAPVREIYDKAEAMVRARLAHEVPKKPGLDELLAWLSQRKVAMAVASSSPKYLIETYTQTAQVRDFLTVLVSGEDIPRSKPAPDIFLTAAQRLGVAPAHTLVLEDSYAGVQAGVAGGFITVMVPDLVQPNEELSRMMFACCDSLHEVRALLESGRL